MLDCEEDQPFLQHTTQIVGANGSLAVSSDANSDQQHDLHYKCCPRGEARLTQRVSQNRMSFFERLRSFQLVPFWNKHIRFVKFKRRR